MSFGAGYSASAATVYYVSTTGNDQSSCLSPGAACRTIGKAAGLVNAGDTVQVAPGVYRERLRIRRGGAAGTPVTFRGHDGSGCPVERVDNDPHSRGERPAPEVEMDGFSIEASYLTFECFRVMGVAGASGAGEFQSGFFVQTGNSDIAIVENRIDGTQVPARPWAAISLRSGVALANMAARVRVLRNYAKNTRLGLMIWCREDCLIEDNEVEELRGDGQGDSDYSRFFGEYATFRGNYFHGTVADQCPGCHVDCFQTYNTNTGAVDHLARHMVIEGNTCFEAHEGIIARDGTSTAASDFVSHRNWTIRNNIFAFGPIGSRMSWCAMFDHIGEVTFEHNLCFGGGVTGYVDGTTAIHRYNIHVDAGWKPYFDQLSGYFDGRAQAQANLLYDTADPLRYRMSDWPGAWVNFDPRFVSANGKDFRLDAGSPARNAASGSTAQLDRAGIPRPQAGPPDLGPYEAPQ